MSKRRLRNAGNRPKAPFGAEAAATLAAAAMTTAATLASAGINASATKDSARDQAKATLQLASRQAQALRDQSDKSKEYQQQAQEFTREENAENRSLQKDIQMQLQMLTGQQNINDRLEASKIKVKAGGKTKKLGYPQSLLRGGYIYHNGNMPFKLPHKGSALLVKSYADGDLYTLFGPNHDNGGVDIDFADGSKVEGEGDRIKTGRNKHNAKLGGEYMFVTPYNAYFVSQHDINGTNGAELIDEGMHPLQAYAIQEQEKDMIGINDDGTKKAKLGKRKFLIGGTPTLYDYTSMMYPQVGTDTIGDTAVGVAYDIKNKDKMRSLKCGGSVRRKAKIGDTTMRYANIFFSNGQTGTTTRTNPGITKVDVNKTNPSSKPNGTNIYEGGGFGGWVNRNADTIGAGLNALGNIGGAWITSSANRSAARTLADAQSQAAGIMSEAYRNLRTIDMNSLRREDYAAAHMMPALQAPVSFAENQVAGVNRSLQRRLRNAGRYSMSSAAAQERMANAEVEAQDQRNRVYSTDQQQMQQIRQANAERVNEASKINAMLDTQANERYGQDYLRLLQYNNDIENTKILGSAGAISEGAINGANAISQGQTSSAQAWATALGNSGLTFSNTLSTMAKRKADFENTMLGATTDAQINQIARNGSRNEKVARLNAVRAAINSGKLSSEDEAKYRYYESLLSKSV